MSKNIVIIKNLASVGNEAIEVENFSDKNVRKAIEKLSGIPGKDLQCENASTSQTFYSIRKNIPTHEKLVTSTIFMHINEGGQTIPVIHVEYATLRNWK